MLTKEQINELFAFCGKHFVHYYDLKVELVDHLANAIEAKMEPDKTISFDMALESVYAGFGVKGFGQIVKTKTEALQRSYSSKRISFVRSFFTWPKAAMLLCVFLVLGSLKNWLTADQLYFLSNFLPFLLLAFEGMIIYSVSHLWKQQKIKLLLTDMGKEQSFFVLVAILFIIGFPSRSAFDDIGSVVFLVDYYFTIITAILVVLFLVAYRRVYISVHELARKQYPSAFE